MKRALLILCVIFNCCVLSSCVPCYAGTVIDGVNTTVSGASIDDTAGNGDATVVYSADKVFDLLALKQAALSVYTTITALWASGSCTGLLNSDGTCKAIGTDVQAYDANTVKKAAAAFTEGQYTISDADGKLVSGGAPVTYTEPAANVPLCRTGANATGACTNITDTVKEIAVFGWDGSWSALTAAATTKRCKIIPGAATLTGLYASVQAESTSNVTIALYLDNFTAGSHATTAMISGTNAVVIPAAGTVLNVNDTTLTGFTTAIPAGSQICAEITATDTTTWIQLELYGKR